MTASAPFLFVAANAVQEIKDGILRAGGITGRRIDERLAFVANGCRVVLDHLELAVRDVLAGLVETFRRRREGGFIVRAEHDGLPASTSARSRPRRGGRFRSCSPFAPGHDFLPSKVANFPLELDLVSRDLAGVGDANVVALEIQHLDERNSLAVDLAFLQRGFALLAVDLRVRLPGHVRAVLLEREGILLRTYR